MVKDRIDILGLELMEGERGVRVEGRRRKWCGVVKDKIEELGPG